MKLSFGFSPCPNDTFIFDALVNKKIDTEDLDFEVHLEDVQTLNKWALKGKLDVSKISYGVLPLIVDKYVALKSGGALGKGVGPLLISKNEVENINIEISNLTIAIPGENTTAHMLFSLAFPQAHKKQFVVFNEVERLVLTGDVDAGVIIHENRFTYQDKGLVKLIDLGEYWETQTGLPIPLGGIIINRNFNVEVKEKVDRLIRKSLEYSFGNYPAISSYVKQHAQEMSEDVMRKHIDLYVNDFSLNIGANGKTAVRKLLNVFKQDVGDDIFVD